MIATSSLKEIVIEGRAVGAGRPCFIIAEVGVNHNGSVDIALEMIDAIAVTGADCVKFQTFHAEEFINNFEEMYEYISQGEVVCESQLEMFRRLEIKRDDLSILFERARDKGLVPLSTPTDKSAADLLESLGVNAFKIGSDDLVYSPYLKYVAAKGKPMIISTGMADASDIERAIGVIEKTGNHDICLLHCTSLYPTPDSDVNLNKIPAMAAAYNVPVGFSDHSDGAIAVLGAVALGACMIEKHFTFDKTRKGPDHPHSMDVPEMTAMVRDIRLMESALGSPVKQLTPAEIETVVIQRRCLFARTDIPADTVITADMIEPLRPAIGILPRYIHLVVGRKAQVDITHGEPITWEKV